MEEQIIKAFSGVASYYDQYMMETGHTQAQGKIVDALQHYLNGKKVLDVATGTGFMISKVNDSIGVDASKEMIQEAKRKNPDKPFIIADVEYLPFRDKTFDVVMSCLAYLWFPDRERALQEMKRVSSGKVLIIEEEGTPARLRMNIPGHLRVFFDEIEKLEKLINIKELDSRCLRLAEVDIDGSHKFVVWQINEPSPRIKP